MNLRIDHITKKGISPLIATVIIIGFTIALAAVVMTWGGDYFKPEVFNPDEDICLEKLSTICGTKEKVLEFAENKFNCATTTFYEDETSEEFCCQQCYEWRTKTKCEKMNDDIDNHRDFTEDEECVCGEYGKEQKYKRKVDLIWTCSYKNGSTSETMSDSKSIEWRRNDECDGGGVSYYRIQYKIKDDVISYCTKIRSKTPKEKLQFELDKYSCEILYNLIYDEPVRDWKLYYLSLISLKGCYLNG